MSEKNYNIFLLQETHSTVKDEIIWRKEWGGEILYEHGLSNSRGVAILFKPTFNFKVDTIYNKDGRILILKVLLNEKELIIVNIYGPNEDNVDFYQHLFSKLEDEECSNMIIGGDYNLVLNLKIDKTGGAIKTNTKSSTYLKQMMDGKHKSS